MSCMYNNFYYWYSKRIVINIITILKTISYGSWSNRVNIEFENIFEQMHKYLSLVQEIACKIVENYFHAWIAAWKH